MVHGEYCAELQNSTANSVRVNAIKLYASKQRVANNEKWFRQA